MDEQLKEALVEIMKTVKMGQDFVIEQAPDVVQQMVVFEYWSRLFGVIGSLVPLVFIGIFWVWFLRNKDDLDYIDEEGCKVLGVVSTLFMGTFSMLGFVVNLQAFIKVSVAPKLFIIEEIGRIIN